MMIHNQVTPPVQADALRPLDAGAQPVTAFGSRSARVSTFADQSITGGDLARERLLHEMTADPEKTHQSLLERLQKRGADKPADGIGGWLSRSAPSVSRKLTSVTVPESLEQPQSPDQLTTDGNFVRLGNPQPELIQQKKSRAGDIVYRFSFNGTEGAGQLGTNLELSNCFYTPDRMPLMSGVDLDLLKLTRGYNKHCLEAGDRVYSGSMNIKVQVDKPVRATVFRLVPHDDVNLYKSKNDRESFMLPDSSVNTFWSLVADGMRFEKEGKSPFTIAIEPHNDQLYFTVKIRAQYEPFSDGAPCNTPFTPESAVDDHALCCGGNQDVKYIYAAPYTKGEWFDIGFETVFSPLAGEDPHRGQVRLWRDGEQVAQVSGWIGGNNRAQYGGGGYHAQFGIVDAVDSMVVKFRMIDLSPFKHQLSGSLKPFPTTQLSGQCRSDESVPSEGPTTGHATEPATTETPNARQTITTEQET